ncbi:MAG: M15 family metallopeptidase [Ruminococcus sp.]|nr:M15 family metallopeptidase [Ruminococcus sp.]
MSTIENGKLVLIKKYIPDIHIDLRYATDNNFTGQKIYSSSEAYLCYGTVRKLIKVQDRLKEFGLSLLVWDAYRPYEAQKKLWEVYPDPRYVADPRNGLTAHCFGNTVDVGLVTLAGELVELPSEFDEFSSKADRDYSDATEKAAHNAKLLEKIMEEEGFIGYSEEWWHYSDTEKYELIK